MASAAALRATRRVSSTRPRPSSDYADGGAFTPECIRFNSRMASAAASRAARRASSMRPRPSSDQLPVLMQLYRCTLLICGWHQLLLQGPQGGHHHGDGPSRLPVLIKHCSASQCAAAGCQRMCFSGQYCDCAGSTGGCSRCCLLQRRGVCLHIMFVLDCCYAARWQAIECMAQQPWLLAIMRQR